LKDNPAAKPEAAAKLAIHLRHLLRARRAKNHNVEIFRHKGQLMIDLANVLKEVDNMATVFC
jgi:hypothetical protein